MQVLDLSRRVKDTAAVTQKIQNKFDTYRAMRRLSASLLAGKMAGMVALSTLLPAGGLAATDVQSLFLPVDVQVEEQATVDRPQLVLDATDPVDPITLADRPELTITVTESPVEAKARSARRKYASSGRAASADAVADVALAIKRELAQRAAAAYGIDWKLVEAVWQIESGKRWKSGVQSSAGAQGPMQFMPGTWRTYATDGNGDGVADITDAQDAVYAGAKYLAANGAATNVDGALLRYNHAGWYVTKVKNLAATIQ